MGASDLASGRLDFLHAGFRGDDRTGDLAISKGLGNLWHKGNRGWRSLLAVPILVRILRVYCLVDSSIDLFDFVKTDIGDLFEGWCFFAL